MTLEGDQTSQEEKYLFDFLYVDKERIAAYCAQLFPNGVHTTTKTYSSDQSKQTEKVSLGFPKIVATESDSTDYITNSIERQYDATWHRTISFLQELNERGFISHDLTDASLGGIALIKGRLQILDIRMIKDMWDSIFEYQLNQMPENTTSERQNKQKMRTELKLTANVAKSMPHTIQLRCFNDKTDSWATLKPEGLIINPDDLAYKHGASIPGEWIIICILDAYPDSSDDTVFPPILNDMEVGMLKMLIQMKVMLGKSFNSYGITPLVIYRPIAHFGHKKSAD
ncbi:hypothetical protein [Oxalobacter paraformigenes]|uniref:Uncharacterized protein n=1 Tax=Oxalobacter paraformigenes TaxID=556268 RepID=C3X358_9BURK|nr:hypothetical protein [Oxalobacter paraformigenes]EEO27644.1 hypothetical protein OFAG_00797 [Oxalobacter paraformigenes]